MGEQCGMGGTSPPPRARPAQAQARDGGRTCNIYDTPPSVHGCVWARNRTTALHHFRCSPLARLCSWGLGIFYSTAFACPITAASGALTRLRHSSLIPLRNSSPLSCTAGNYFHSLHRLLSSLPCSDSVRLRWSGFLLKCQAPPSGPAGESVL